jgi:uroporphyrinogen-III synthase
MRLAVTRPRPEGERTAQFLRGLGHEAIHAPLLHFIALPFTPPAEAQWNGILFTSANAVRALTEAACAALTNLPVFAVGERTAEVARDAGFMHVTFAAGDGQSLAALVIEHFDQTRPRLLHVTGEDRAFDFTTGLAPHGIAVDTIAIYRMQAVTEVPSALALALREASVDGVLHYSRRSGETYLDCAALAELRAAALAPVHYCLSEQVAAPFVAAGAPRVRIASQPDEASLIRLLEDG